MELRLHGKLARSQSLAYPIFVLLLCYVSCLLAAADQSKASSLLVFIMNDFGMSYAQAGLITSCFTFAGLIMSLPHGFICSRFGVRHAAIMSITCLTIGSFVGAFAQSAIVLYISRIIEGLGAGLSFIMATTAVSAWFPKSKRGIPIGILGTQMSVGTIIAFILGPWLGSYGEWRNVWMTCAFIGIALLLLIGLFLVNPPSDANANHGDDRDSRNEGGAGSWRSFALLARTPSIWLLAIVIFAEAFTFSCFMAFYPTYLSTELDFSVARASHMPIIANLCIMVMAIAAGWLSDKVANRGLLLLVPLVFFALLVTAAFRIPSSSVPALMVLYGLVGGLIPTTVYAAIPDVAGKVSLVGFGMSVMALGQSLGSMVGPLLFGAVIDSAGWVMAGDILTPVLLLGAIASLAYSMLVRKARRSASNEEQDSSQPALRK